MLTPKNAWLPTEALQNGGRSHPPGILPPNGATVYKIHDVNGYDSLSLRQYRAWIGGAEPGGPSPQLNGNMVLLENLAPEILDSLAVRYVVAAQGTPLSSAAGNKVFSANGCDVWQREIRSNLRVSGASFSPGWKEGRYQPQGFRFGTFISLCALGLIAGALGFKKSSSRAIKAH
jgi:hypothetical protein